MTTPAGDARHASPKRGLPGVTRIIADPKATAVVVTDGVVSVPAGMKGAERRQAVRKALGKMHRHPGLVMIPGMAGLKVRRVVNAAASWVAAFGDHATSLIVNNSGFATVGVGVLLAAGAVGGAAVTGNLPQSPFTSGNSITGGITGDAPPPPVYAHLPADPASYLGAYEKDTPGTYGSIAGFGHLIGHRPNLGLYYSGWGEPFQLEFADEARANGAAPLVQLDPAGISLAAIVAGQYDAYLTSFALSVHAYAGNVVISFGHEMNAPWYPWGYRHADPAVFVAAWQHIVILFRAQGDFNVTWLWTVNISSPQTSPLSAWWPGSPYVTWVGIDGYYAQPGDTFSNVFGPTITSVQAITGKPVLIAETATTPPQAPEVTQIAGLFNGIRSHQILGFIWFDEPGRTGRNWRIEGDAAAIAAFRQAVSNFGNASTSAHVSLSHPARTVLAADRQTPPGRLPVPSAPTPPAMTIRKASAVLTPYHVIQAAAHRQRLTIADLRTFLAEAEAAGVPDDARPLVSTSWRRHALRLEVRRPQGGAAIRQEARL